MPTLSYDHGSGIVPLLEREAQAAATDEWRKDASVSSIAKAVSLIRVTERRWNARPVVSSNPSLFAASVNILQTVLTPIQ